MANENQSWNVTLNWELSHEKGIAQATLLLPDGSKKSLKYVQGMFFNEKGKIADKAEADAIIYLLKLLSKKEDV